MVGYLENFVRIILELPVFPNHWDNYFYEYFNLRKRGYSRKHAKKQAMKMTDWKYMK